jgi:hypothetical protein
MSYTIGSTINTRGWNPLLLSGYSPGLGSLALSGISDALKQEALARGMDPGLLSTVDALGADDAQLDFYLNGEISFEQLLTWVQTGIDPWTSPAGAGQPIPLPGTIGPDGQDTSQPAAWYDFLGQLQQENARLKWMESRVAAEPAIAQQFGAAVAAARSQYGSIASDFISLYESVFGETPAGLSGLGIAPIIIAAYAAGALVVILIAWSTYLTYSRNLYNQIVAAPQAQAQQQAAANQATLLAAAAQADRQAAAAAAAGDYARAAQLTTQAAQLRAQAGSPAGSTPAAGSLSGWFQSNWKWLALAVGAIAIAPPLIKKL